MPMIDPDWRGEITAMYVRMQRGLYDDVLGMLEILHDPDLVEAVMQEMDEALEWGEYSDDVE